MSFLKFKLFEVALSNPLDDEKHVSFSVNHKYYHLYFD